MVAPPPRRRPAYTLHSVDNSLRLLQMLRDLGALRIKDAAAELGVATSTVHRLMSMLVFRGFAVQDESRVYRPGPSIGVSAVSVSGVKQLQRTVRPHLLNLRDALGESVNLMVLTGTDVRFLITAEAAHPTHAGDRHGFVLPAHSSAGGRAILATLSDTAVDRLYSDVEQPLDTDEMRRLCGELALVRSRGYAVSADEAEQGVVSVASPIDQRSLAAISVAGPTTRMRRITSGDFVSALMATRQRIVETLTSLDTEVI